MSRAAGGQQWGGGRGAAGLAGRLRGLAHLPREQTLARLGYDLKRPVFALPFYRFSLPGLTATALAVTPSDPWPGDAERGAAIVRGTFTLAGRTVVDPAPLWAPFGVDPGWVGELHGFAWLRDLRAAGGDGPRRRARELVRAWLDDNATWNARAWDPLATGRRLANWLGCYEFFVASAEIDFRHRLLVSLAQQAQHLARVLPAGLAGADLIAALKGLITAGVALPGGESWRRRGLELLRRELARQILSDGGHAERSPSRHLAVLRDLIDVRAVLRRAEAQAGRGDAPDELHRAVEAMAPALRMFQHGDGGLALFNGSVEEDGWLVDLVLQRAGGSRRPLGLAAESGFARLRAGRTVVLVDAGAPPGPGLDRRGHAGTLAFEMSVGRERLVVNCGARPDDPAWRRAQRTTAAHSTLVLGDTNSSDLLPEGGFGRVARVVECRRETAAGRTWLELAHDGYLRSFGARHRRRLYLAADGADLRGEDRLEPAGATSAPVPFVVRFHLGPSVRASLARGGDRVLLRLPKGGGWQLRAVGAALSLEPSVYLGRAGEVRRTQQVVLAGECRPRGALVKWALRRLEGRRG